MAYSEIAKSLVVAGSKPFVTFWTKVKDNFDAHEAGIIAIETAPSEIPIGAILMFGSDTPPTGHLLCDGSAVSRSTYSALFAITGTSFGTGDGSTTFNLPDMKGRAPIGIGTGSGLTARSRGDKVGVETHTLVTAEMPSHTHTVTDPGHTHTSNTSNTLGAAGNFVARGTTTSRVEQTITTASATTGLTIADTGGDDPHNNMAPFLTCGFVIKAVA